MFPHSEMALASSDIYLKQYDTIFCYNELARISHQLVRYLEAEGYQAVVVPAFLPLDMGDGTMGLVGAIDWKQAAVESGLASWGKNGLVVNPRFGRRIRLGGLITTAELKPDSKLDFSPCDNCQLCVESCPAGALLGDGQMDKKRCAEQILSYGLRAFSRLLVDVAKAKDEAEAKGLVYSYRTRELWQALRNIWKHSEATKAEVVMELGEDRTTITISDNGKGFDADESLGFLKTGKLGLAGMKERAYLLGGTLGIHSKLNSGTKVILDIPSKNLVM